MRILFLSNFYPPARPGGYTQWCYEVAEELKLRGHTIAVLTSNYESNKAPREETGVYRLLHLEGDLEYYEPLKFFLTHPRNKRTNFQSVQNVVKQFSPDLIFVWGMWSMSKEIPALVEKLMPGKVLYYLSDYWPSAIDRHTKYWNTPANHWYTALPKGILRRVALSSVFASIELDLKFEHAICVSQAVKSILIKDDVPLRNARVIHGGTDTSRFNGYQPRNFSTRPIRYLYAGQLEYHKGVHTAVQALAILVNLYNVEDICLMIVGSGHSQYEQYLRKLVEQESVTNFVQFSGYASREQMPHIMQNSHVLIFPSIYEEPFARMTQEAMLSGLVVIGTTTGGTKEILEDGVTGLTFQAEDSTDLASKMVEVIESPQMCSRLAHSGREAVLANFTLDKMVDYIEEYIMMLDS